MTFLILKIMHTISIKKAIDINSILALLILYIKIRPNSKPIIIFYKDNYTANKFTNHNSKIIVYK